MSDPSDDVRAAESRSGRGVGWRYAVGFALIITLASIAALVALNGAGTSARAVPAAAPEIVVVDDARGLLAAWNTAGIHGAHLIYATRDLGYALPDNVFQHSSESPVSLVDLDKVYRDNVARSNIVWVASHTGIARSVTYVLTPQDLAEKVQLGRQNGWPGISADGRSIAARDEEGYTRVVGAEVPVRGPESAILNIDASYFVNGTPEALAAQLKQSGQSFGFVSLNRSVDATDVPDAARARLEVMANLLRKQASK